MDSVLRPRDIQARIRSGESPETVAAAAQTTVEKIVGFATPVLAERAYVAQQAQKASVRRRAGDGHAGHLGDAVAERLATRGIDIDTVEWDAWRREDGRWTLVADYGSGESSVRAQFVYDTAGRYVVAEDEESRWLIGERRAAEAVAPVPSPMSAGTGRRLSAVPSRQLPLGDDAIEMVTGQRPAAGILDTVESVDVGEAGAPGEAPAGDADDRRASDASGFEESTVDLTEPLHAVRAASAPEGPEQPASPAPASASAAPGPEPDALFDAPSPLEEPAEPVAPGEQKDRRSARARGRASVPSWDEIMLGSSRRE
jgi:hypothetical protein